MNEKVIWKTTLEQLEISLPVTDFHTFFHNTMINQISQKDGVTVVEIGTPHPFTAQRLEEKYADKISKHLKSILKTEVELIFAKRQEEKMGEEDLGPIFKQQIVKHQKDDDESNLNEEYTFENFVVGNHNQLASAIAMSVAEQPGSYNPFFLYSGVGLGKTHLMQAIGNRIKQNQTQARVMYCPMETFMNSLVEAIRHRTQASFKRRYRNIDVLLIDDVQSIAGKETTQEELFNTFNSLYLAQKQLVFTSDRPPKDIPRIEERLKSRFSAGMIADMQTPDSDVRLAILNTKENQYQHQLDPEIKNLIADNVSTNIRELEGSFRQVMFWERSHHQKIPISEVEKVLKLNLNIRDKQFATPQQIMKITCEHFDITIKDLKGPCRQKHLVYPRQITMYLLNKKAGLPLITVGDLLGGRDHTTILHGVRTVEKRIKDPQSITAQEIHNLGKKLS